MDAESKAIEKKIQSEVDQFKSLQKGKKTSDIVQTHSLFRKPYYAYSEFTANQVEFVWARKYCMATFSFIK